MGTSNVPTEKQSSSFYFKLSSLLTPYILLQPEINIGKTIWHISRFHKNLIKEPSKFSLCAIAFCKELIIRVRPDLETYIFMVIKNSHVQYFKYFLYVLQCEQQELCWQITLQPSFLLGFNAFLRAIIKPELNYYPTNFRYIKITRAMVVIERYIAILLMIFTSNNLESIRRLTVEDVHSCISLIKKEDKSSCIPQYQIILDLSPIEVIVHFLQLRKKMWKTSNFIFTGSVSGIPLTSESLLKIISIQLKGIGLS
jgi:hypothetical protein